MSDGGAPRFAADQLRAFVERVQRLDEELKSINDDKRDVYAEAKGAGFDVPALKAVVSYLRKDQDRAKEQAAIFEVYLDVLTGTQIATRVHAREGRPASLGAAATPAPESPSVANTTAPIGDGAAGATPPDPATTQSVADEHDLQPVGDGGAGAARPPAPASTNLDIPEFLRRPVGQQPAEAVA